ncbi:MAG: hypothetical protein HYV42_02760 [Candidatus Magasanikbacteria bacterium]|nr:hypothetical protein [Candidatus Magasanikbacteria bacterium]
MRTPAFSFWFDFLNLYGRVKHNKEEVSMATWREWILDIIARRASWPAGFLGLMVATVLWALNPQRGKFPW